MLPSPSWLSRPRRRLLSVLAVTLALVASACVLAVRTSPTAEERGLRFDGPAADAVLDADAVEDLAFRVRADGDDLADLAFRLDGEVVTAGVDRADGVLGYRPAGIADGRRVVDVIVAPADDGRGGDPAEEPAPPTVLHRWAFTVDTTPPPLSVDERDGAAVAGEPLTVAGDTEPGAAVTLGSLSAVAGADGAFALELPAATDGTLELVATDDAGNTTATEVTVVTVPSRVEAEEVRALHMSFYGWASSLKDGVMSMLEDGRIDAIQLDLKDESGTIAYDSQVPLAKEIGASLGIWDLEEAVAEIHATGAPVIGRIVAFADPTLVRWSWEHGHRDRVIQLPDGSAPYTGKYAGFSNFVHPDVIAYNLAVAEEAARAGVDHILWDYIRRPDGGLSNFTVPGLMTTPEEAIVAFTRMADERLAPYGVQHGASVFGIAADRPTQIGQDIPAMAEHLDYVAPMIYPSHWGPGEYGVADPNRQPYDIVTATLEVWKEVTAGTGARVIPWLEDTSYRAWDRPHQVREQIRATRDQGIDSFLMWDPNVRYTPTAYDPPDDPPTD